jgi:hypothetical protein
VVGFGWWGKWKGDRNEADLYMFSQTLIQESSFHSYKLACFVHGAEYSEVLMIHLTS